MSAHNDGQDLSAVQQVRLAGAIRDYHSAHYDNPMVTAVVKGLTNQIIATLIRKEDEDLFRQYAIPVVKGRRITLTPEQHELIDRSLR